MQFEIEIQGKQNLDRKLDKLKFSLMNMSETFKAVGTAFAKYYKNAPFASRGTVYGKAWASLNPAYKSWKADNYPGKPILIREGTLSQGFDFESDTNSVRLFNRVDYFEKHQKGIGVPQRVMMALNTERKSAATDIIREDIRRKMSAL